jgi:hypothetical protein
MKDVNVKGGGVLTQVMGALLWVVAVAECDRYVGEGWEWYRVPLGLVPST